MEGEREREKGETEEEQEGVVDRWEYEGGKPAVSLLTPPQLYQCSIETHEAEGREV